MTTLASVWKFDLDRMMYVRFPKGERPDPFNKIPYTCQWEPFLEIERGGTRLLVIRPVPHGSGRCRTTGDIITDSHPELDRVLPVEVSP